MRQHLVLIIGMGLIAIHLCSLVLTLPQPPVSLTETVLTAMPHSGVKNPVTAVLLNFRGYDTLLEVAVLLLAVLGVWSLPRAPVYSPFAEPQTHRVVAVTLLRFIVPLAIVVGGYLLWIGADAPGGAFQAAAVLTGAWLLLLLVGYPERILPPERWLRPLLVGGFAVFLGVACGMLVLGRSLLEYPPEWTKAWLLLIESALTISITCILVSLFVGRPHQVLVTAPSESRSPAPEETP